MRVRARDSVVLVSPLLVTAAYGWAIETLSRTMSHAWIVCNAFYYLWCLLSAVSLGERSYRALLSLFKPRRVEGVRSQAAVSAIVVFFALVGLSSLYSNGRLVARYLPQTVAFMVINRSSRSCTGGASCSGGLGPGGSRQPPTRPLRSRSSTTRPCSQ